MTVLPPTPRVVVYPDADTLAAGTAARLITRITDVQSVTSPVHIVLTGGTVGTKTLAAIVNEPAAGAVDWAQVHFWWGDERFLVGGDPERNETGAREVFLSRFAEAIPEANIHQMPALDPEGGVATPEIAAELYAGELAEFAPDGVGVPEFDVLMLGVGPDGHIASLFPGNAALDASGTVVAVRDSPKPPPLRVSLTFDAIEAARAIWLVPAGADKADAVASAWSGAPRKVTPAGSVRGTEETLWLVDVAAASKGSRGKG